MHVTTTKVLVPLATLLVAGAVAVGSGATFSSESNNTVSAVTSGTLKQTNSKDGSAIFSLSDIKPGDTVNGSLTLTNSGTLPATFSLVETGSTNTFGGSDLTMSITNTTTGAPVWSGTFGALVDGAHTDLGLVQPGVANSYRFSVHLADNAPNTDQGQTGTASYRWESVQLEGTTTNQ